PIQVKLVVKESLKLLRASLPTTIEIRQNIKSDSLIMGDPTQIHQIMMNLCINAGHAMQAKGGVLEVNLTDLELDLASGAGYPDLNSGHYLQLTVSDTGHGMRPEVAEQIFDPFFTTKGPGEGTGLGLSVVHGIVKSHGGDIHAYSEPGEGTTFKVLFPAVERLKEPEPREERPIPVGTEHILFIDDEPSLAKMGHQILESLGYKVTSRTSSVEALELFKAQPDRFDLVITDMTMPHMTGKELSAKLMKIRPDIPIILCTGFSSRINEEKVSAIGIQAFVMKPILRRTMAETIRRVLDQDIEEE
ncbi:MAG: ATP-binding protein, partial [Methanosarcinaceae archaeon]|nr:ATP-binding protein [Methanosarcinaceae archaeon]